MKNEGYDLDISRWAEVNPVKFIMFFFIFWSQKFNISTRYPFHIQNTKVRQNASKWHCQNLLDHFINAGIKKKSFWNFAIFLFFSPFQR